VVEGDLGSTERKSIWGERGGMGPSSGSKWGNKPGGDIGVHKEKGKAQSGFWTIFARGLEHKKRNRLGPIGKGKP